MRFLPVAALSLLACFVSAADPRGDNPDAAPQTPEQQRAQFHLPPGFEIQLVAAETEIQKPINLNFDAAGRLWATGSELYPWPASTDAAGHPIPDFAKAYDEMASAFRVTGKAPPPSAQARDTVRILSDFGPDGRARKVEIFAAGLNIPSGVQPLPRAPGAKGDTAIVYSIPYIWRLEDRDGDGKAEHREILYGPFGYLDTHGGSSSYIYWMDGWIYGTHGFRNHSEVRDKNGKVVTLDSGNTYRFKPDGSAFEQYTHGQTNPFGLTFDPMGNLYSADSHSKPVYLLLRGGYYEGIGKQHDGLGFAPRITDDDHGSSAIAGIAYYADEKFPEEFRGNLFNGNPVTRRINRDKLEWHGSTPKAIRQEDFLTSDDPWFRPVQVKLGPDGALYIADFYNAIIGHYEFPLADPRRDHTHGRIWRIVYKGAKHEHTDLTGASPTALTHSLGSANLELRRLATNELVNRGVISKAPMEKLLAGALDQNSSTPSQQVCALHVLNRLNLLGDGRLATNLLETKSPELGALLARLLADPAMQRNYPTVAAYFLRSTTDPGVRRAAVTAISETYAGGAPGVGFISLVAHGLLEVDSVDSELRHSFRIALRDLLLRPGGFAKAEELSVHDPRLGAAIADVASAVPTPESSRFLLDYLGHGGFYIPQLSEVVRQIVASAAEDEVAKAAAELQQISVTAEPPQQLDMAVGMSAGAQKRAKPLPQPVSAWIEQTILAALASPDPAVLKRALTATRDLKTDAKRAPLHAIISDSTRPRDLRLAALEAVANVSLSEVTIAAALHDHTDMALRRKAAEVLGRIGSPDARKTLAEALPYAPWELALSIAGALVQREEGARVLVETVAAGKASPMLLRNKLAAMMVERVAPDLMPRLGLLTRDLPSEDARVDQAIAARVEAFEKMQRSRPGLTRLDRTHGAQLFKATCAACHKFRNEGGNVGPNLDGVAARGLPRLIEDILDPNRNVDPAFRQVVIKTTDGRTLAGLNPREEGPNLLLTDATGATLSVAKAQVKSRTPSPLSLMPAAFEQALAPEDLNDLLAYLIIPAT